jgi:hypothetical protein
MSQFCVSEAFAIARSMEAKKCANPILKITVLASFQ